MAPKLRQESNRCSCFQVRVEITFERRRLDRLRKVCQNTWWMCDVVQQVNLQVGSEGIGQSHVTWERTENEISHLYAVGWNDIAETEMIIAQEFREIV